MIYIDHVEEATRLCSERDRNDPNAPSLEEILEHYYEVLLPSIYHGFSSYDDFTSSVLENLDE